MPDTHSNPSQWNALRKIVKRLPTHLAYYGSALGAIVLAGGGQLPPGLEFVAGSIGGNMLSNIIHDIVNEKDPSSDEIRERAKEAIDKSDIANRLTKQDFLQGYARLIQRLDAQKIISQDILHELQTGFSKVASADQVEELKRLILQLMQHPPQTVTRKTRLFISYDRADDEPFVERLYHDLKDEFEVWWDRETMSNRGKTFLQEIRDAIDYADRLLLVTGPHAFTSDYVRDEWQYTYETYKGINIALRLGDYTDFPTQLRGFDAPDFRNDADYEERLATLKRQLEEPVAPIGAFHNVPALPPHFLNRLDALDALRQLVIADVDKPTLISAEKRTTAVEGMGGIGKSVLAAAFAHDRKVRFAFPDGIVWLNVGRKPSMYELYRAVGVALGDYLSDYPDETIARQKAQKALASKKCLLILDDIWELPVGHAFRDLISGTTSRLLITTRNLQINDLLNANEYRLKLIDKLQAADYLRSWVGDDPKLDAIAEKLGYLFLALKLAGARMKKDNLSGTDYLLNFDRVSRMKVDRNSASRDDSLEASITLSVDAAFVGIEDDRLLYHTFGIFQEDTYIPQQTILQLWRYLRPESDEFDLLETLTTLVDLALADRHEDRAITLHDLLHSYVREKLGNHYIQMHMDLLASYKVEQWHRLPSDEPYLWWYIAHHFYSAEQFTTFRQLLLDCDFLQKKLNITGVIHVIEDFQYVSNDEVIRLIGQAFRMSLPALAQDLNSWPQQLVGRLMIHRSNNKEIEIFTNQLQQIPNQLMPVDLDTRYIPFQSAGDSLLTTIAGPSDGAVELSGGRIVSFKSGSVRGGDNNEWCLWENNGMLVRKLPEVHKYFSGMGASSLSVNVLALTDGRFISWAADPTLRLWNSEGKMLTSLEGHIGPIGGVVELTNGRFLSWGWEKDESLMLWDMHGQLLFTLQGYSGSSAYAKKGALVLSDGHFLFWSPNPGRARLCDGNGQTLAAYEISGHVIGASTLGDGRLVIYTSRSLLLFDRDGNHSATFRGHDAGITGITELTNERIVTWADNSQLLLWDKDGNLLNTIEIYTAGVGGVLALADGCFVSWGALNRLSDKNHILQLWDRHGNLLINLEGHTRQVAGALLLSDHLFVSWGDNVILIWDSEGKLVKSLEGHNNVVIGALKLRDGRLLSWSQDNSLRLWDVYNLPLLQLRPHKGRVNAIFLTTQRRLITWSRGNELHIWSMQGQLLSTLNQSTFEHIVRLTNDNFLSWGGKTVWIWSASGQAVATLDKHNHTVNGVIELSDGRIISWGGKTVWIWSASGQAVATLDKHNHTVNGVIELSDGRIISWGGNALWIWDASGVAISTFDWHSDMISGVMELSDGGIVSWGGNTLWVWRAGQYLAKLDRHTTHVIRAQRLPNNNFLSWSEVYWDKDYHVLDVDPIMRVWDNSGNLIKEINLQGHLANSLVLDNGNVVFRISKINAYWDGSTYLENQELWLCDGACNLISRLVNIFNITQNDIFEWARQNDIGIEFISGLSCTNKNYKAIANGSIVEFYSSQMSECKAKFHSDANISFVILSPEDLLLIGDAAGRVIFLKYTGEFDK